jgi:hypothetical protein
VARGAAGGRRAVIVHTSTNETSVSFFESMFTPDHERYDGVRPINVWLLRVFYFLMAAFVGTDAWRTILTHQGAWDPVRAVAWCGWAAYPTLAVLGLVHPLRMLPIMLFMIFYKTLWLAVVAYPLWRAGTLGASPANEMAHVFIWVCVPLVVLPWGYVWRTYVRWPGKSAETTNALRSRVTSAIP